MHELPLSRAEGVYVLAAIRQMLVDERGILDEDEKEIYRNVRDKLQGFYPDMPQELVQKLQSETEQ